MFYLNGISYRKLHFNCECFLRKSLFVFRDAKLGRKFIYQLYKLALHLIHKAFIEQFGNISGNCFRHERSKRVNHQSTEIEKVVKND